MLKTQSKLPSSVYSFIAHPWTSRAVSAEPACGPTVDTRSSTGDFFPGDRKLAEVMSEQSPVASNSPYALWRVVSFPVLAFEIPRLYLTRPLSHEQHCSRLVLDRDSPQDTSTLTAQESSPGKNGPASRSIAYPGAARVRRPTHCAAGHWCWGWRMDNLVG